MPTYKDKKDGRWRYQFTVNRKKYSGSSPIARNTERAAAEVERAHIDRITNRRFAGIMPTIAKFIVRFLAYQKHHTKPLTYNLHESICRVHIEPHIGKKTIDEIRRAEIDQLVLRWACAPRTANTRLGVLLRMLALAKSWEILDAVPEVSLVKVPKDHPRFLTEIEAHALLEAATAPWRTMVLTGLRTGLRIGELRGLQWGDIDWKRRVLHVRRTDPGRPDMEATSPKSNKPRTVPLTPELFDALQKWHEQARTKDPDAWVFAGALTWRAQRNRDRTRSDAGCKTMIRRFAVDAGLEDVSWHTLRHTFASWLVMRNAPLSVVQELLGHASIRQTERYAHLSPGFAQHAALAALDIPMLPVGEQALLEAPKSTRPKPAFKPKHPKKPRRPLVDRPNIERKRRRKLPPAPPPPTHEM